MACTSGWKPLYAARSSSRSPLADHDSGVIQSAFSGTDVTKYSSSRLRVTKYTTMCRSAPHHLVRTGAIVTDIAGTTRDVLRETIQVDGLWLTLADTAGLRETEETVEAEGIRRARGELAKADLVLAVLDDTSNAFASLAEALQGLESAAAQQCDRLGMRHFSHVGLDVRTVAA